MKNILVIGSINMDLIIHSPVIPKIGQTISGSGFATVCGGKGANQAIAVGRLLGNVKMLGAVGGDLYGEASIKNLTQSGVDCKNIIKTETTTGIAVIYVVKGNNCITIDSGANSAVTPLVIDNNSELFEWADIVLLQFEIPSEAVIHAIKKAKQYNNFVIVNPAPAREIPNELYRYIDIIIPNETEAQALTGILPDSRESCEKAVLSLHSKGVKQVIITLGAKGCVFNDGEKIKFQSAYDITAVDSTAAGDCFIGALCVSLCNEKSLEAAVQFASAASAIAVSRIGASTSLPTAEEVARFITDRI